GFVVENAEVGELLCQAGAVRCVDPGNDAGPVLLVVGRASTGKYGFTGGQPTDRHRLDIARMLLGEGAVEFLVVLAVVAHQHPLDAGELGGEPRQGVGLVFPSAPEPAI